MEAGSTHFTILKPYSMLMIGMAFKNKLIYVAVYFENNKVKQYCINLYSFKNHLQPVDYFIMYINIINISKFS